MYLDLLLIVVLFQSCGDNKHEYIIPDRVHSIIIVDKRSVPFKGDTVLLTEQNAIKEIVQQLNNGEPALVKFVPRFDLYLIFPSDTMLVMVNNKSMVYDGGKKYVLKRNIEPILERFFKH